MGSSNGLTNHPGGDVYRGLLMHAGLLLLFECYCFLIYIIVGPPQPWPPHFYFTKVIFFTFSRVSPRREHECPGRHTCCCRFRRDARPDLTFTKKHFFTKCSFVETPGPIYPPWIPLLPPWVSLGLPWVPSGPPLFLPTVSHF